MSIVLTTDELLQLTGYRRPSEQLKELHRQGFYRARIGPQGVVLERAHFDAVCRGINEPQRPKVKVPQLKAA